MDMLRLPSLQDVPFMDHFLSEKGLHNYEMDRHTRLIYHPVYGLFFRRRFTLGIKLLAQSLDPQAQRCVEVGYSAGLVLPSLSPLARTLVGIDTIEPRAVALVRTMLGKMNVGNVSLLQGSVAAMPLESASVDGLLCLSVLEHLHPQKDLQHAAKEITRVLRPGGVAVLGFPVKNPVTKVLLRIAGVDDEEVHPASHRHIIAEFRKQGDLSVTLRRWPWFLPADFGLYALLHVRKNHVPGDRAR